MLDKNCIDTLLYSRYDTCLQRIVTIVMAIFVRKIKIILNTTPARNAMRTMSLAAKNVKTILNEWLI